MKRILLPTDFSENAYNAIEYALKLFKDVECRFYLLHTYTPAAYEAQYLLESPGQIGLGDIYQTNSLSGLERLEERLNGNFPNKKHSFERISALNVLTDEMINCIDTYDIHLVIMGTQGATGAQEYLFGTNTIHFINKRKCPVLAIPANYYFEKPQEILFPSDYNLKFKKKQLAALKDIGTLCNARINFLHVRNQLELTVDQKKNREFLDDYFKEVSHLFHSVADQDIVEAIEENQIQTKANLIALVNNKHSFLENILFEPVVKQFVFHPKVPLLVIPS